MASPIPSFMSYGKACVLPLCLSIAACGLFQKDFLALPYPIVSPKPSGKTLLVWGGSTSVGSNAIQLAVAVGHEVITTALPQNFDYVRRLGAVEVFDYRSKMIVKDIIEALRNRESAGAFAIDTGSLKACIEILAAPKGRKFVAQASIDLPGEMLLLE
jgi:NADPH:quinone reductase-like Zn-dependent oxidoreductase